MTTKIQKQAGEIIIEKICISEITTMINRFIKGLESLNMSPNALKIVLNLLEKIDGKPRIGLIDKLLFFNKFATKLNIKLTTWLKNIVFNITESINKGKDLKIRHIDIDLDGKSMTYNPKL